MGLQSDVQARLGAAFSARLSDAVSPLTYRDPDEAETTTRGIRSRPSFSEIDGEAVKSTSAKFLILQNEISVEPVVDGWMVHDGIEYYISRVDIDAANAVWRIYGNT